MLHTYTLILIAAVKDTMEEADIGHVRRLQESISEFLKHGSPITIMARNLGRAAQQEPH